jgi:hypothetical protein
MKWNTKSDLIHAFVIFGPADFIDGTLNQFGLLGVRINLVAWISVDLLPGNSSAHLFRPSFLPGLPLCMNRAHLSKYDLTVRDSEP